MMMTIIDNMRTITATITAIRILVVVTVELSVAVGIASVGYCKLPAV